jgi:hypothetical protein
VGRTFLSAILSNPSNPANSATDAHTYDRYDTDSLIINASAGDDSLTLDLSNGNPLRDDIFTFNGGDGADGIKGDGRN